DFIAFLKNETFHFITGLLLVIFSVYLLLALLSFFSTGAADQSIVESNPELLSSIHNGVKNYAGSRGAQLASYLINDCFGISVFFLVVLGVVAGMHLMQVHTFNIRKWFVCCLFLLIWISVFLGFFFMDYYKDSFLYWGGMHGYNASIWLLSQIGAPGTVMILLATGLCFLIYVSTKTILLIRQFFEMRHIRRREKIIARHRKLKEKERVPEKTPENDGSEDVGMTFETTAPDDDVSFIVSRPENEKDTPSNNLIENQEYDNEDTYQSPETQPYNPTLDLENYHFPTLDLLKFYDNRELTINMDEQKANKEKITNTLRSFGIEIGTIKATVGPTVTLYEITPAQGVRISKIRNLEDDIALSLSALG
ncbi:DNA translocase FtsK, partial [termite gut metagenome]